VKIGYNGFGYSSDLHFTPDRRNAEGEGIPV
jgi:hypothetical protein